MFLRFARDEKGNFLILTAFVMMVLVAAAGLAVDIANAMNTKTRIQDALDAAALAAAANPTISEADAKLLAEAYFASNVADIAFFDSPTITAQFQGEKVILTASANVPTTLMRAVAQDKMPVVVRSEVSRGGTNVEVALALDLTGSMVGGRLADLKVAASDFVDTVVADVQTPYTSKVAIVPYSMGVNVGSLANSVRGTPSSGTCTTRGCNYYQFRNTYNQWTTHSNSTCVSERTGPQAYTDAAPSSAPVGWNYPSTNNPCLTSTIMALSSDKTALKSKISGLVAGGSTAGHVGVAWSWYLISPNFAYLLPNASKPTAYDTQKVMKVAVLMTDGEYNSSYCNGVIARSSTTGSGSPYDHINCDATNGSSFDQAVATCAAMKLKNIRVYTIGFEIVDDPRARALMANCASDPSFAFTADNGVELRKAFKAIAVSIQNLRISS